MIISHKYKFIFIKTEKTAGTSIEIFLSNICDEKDIVTPIFPLEKGHNPINYNGLFNPIPEILLSKKIKTKVRSLKEAILCKKFYNHIPAWRVRERIGSTTWSEYFTFCVERNPWDKTLSNYYMLRKRSNNSLSFEKYIRAQSLAINYPMYMDYHQKHQIVDKVIRFENLENELGEVFKKLNITFDGKLGVYAKKNIMKVTLDYKSLFNGKYRNYRELIKHIYEKEIDMFKYKID